MVSPIRMKISDADLKVFLSYLPPNSARPLQVYGQPQNQSTPKSMQGNAGSSSAGLHYLIVVLMLITLQ